MRDGEDAVLIVSCVMQKARLETGGGSEGASSRVPLVVWYGSYFWQFSFLIPDAKIQLSIVGILEC